MLWVILATLAFGKTVTRILNISSDSNWEFLARFHFSEGEGQYSLKLKAWDSLEHEVQIQNFKLAVFLEEAWLDTIDKVNCRSKLEGSSALRDVSITTDGEWSDAISGLLSQTSSGRAWYFVLAYCDNHKYSEKWTRLKAELQITNSDGSQFSLEDQHKVMDNLIYTAVFTLILIATIREVLQKQKRREPVETILAMVMASVGLACLAHGIKAIHLYFYSFDGSGLIIIDFFADSLEMLSNIIITLIFILLSSGWVFEYPEFPEPEVYIPSALAIFVVNVLVLGIARITDDHWDKVTDFHDFPGAINVVIRLVMWGWFWYNINYILVVRKRSQKRFVKKFSWAVSAYFWSILIIIAVSWVVPLLSKQRFVVACQSTVQCAAMVAMLLSFRKQSALYKASVLSASDLPGCSS